MSSMLSERVYLDSTIMPALMEALEYAAVEKPTDPIEFIAHLLLKTQESVQQVVNTAPVVQPSKPKE